MNPSSPSLLPKYEAEVERLLALKVTLEVEEARLKWLVVVGLVAGIGVGIFVKPLYGLLPFALGIVMCGTGLYLTRVHKMERDYNLGRARREVARLRAEEKARVAEAAVRAPIQAAADPSPPTALDPAPSGSPEPPISPPEA